ncbi:MAG: ribonuclease PH [Alphaproteobacteria bacterium]|nr:ribonuclease PH [Alphaproteobacteria bacterium]
MPRPSGRKENELRSVAIVPNVNKYAMGSCLVKWGDTHVLCTATIEDKAPSWMKAQGKKGGWLTAEYGMVPHAGNIRKDRDAIKGKQDGRSVEIQRLIGRALRTVVDLHQMDNKTIKIDCDVLQADGGTRTASITGGYVALKLAIMRALTEKKLIKDPLIGQVAAVSCGIVQNTPVLDLDYVEDSNAGTDANFVMTADGQLIEVQGSAEGAPFAVEEFQKLLALAQKGIAELIEKQNAALKS